MDKRQVMHQHRPLLLAPPFLALLLLVSVVLPALALGDDEVFQPTLRPEGPVEAFGPGEKMVFSIDYGLINAGEGTLEIVGIKTYQDRPVYHIQSKTNSNRFFSSIYKVRDKIISYIDTEHLYSRYFYKRLREGDYKKTVEISFDHDAGLARYANGQEYPVTPGVQDVLSAFYFVRTLDLAVGEVYHVPAHSSRKSYDLQVIVHGKEKVEVEAGTWDCFVVEPVIQGDGLFKHEGKLTLYMTDDQYHVPGAHQGQGAGGLHRCFPQGVQAWTPPGRDP